MEGTDKKYYIKLVNPTEEEVNELISKGYLPLQVSTIRDEVVKQGNLINVRDSLVYHMLRRKTKEESK